MKLYDWFKSRPTQEKLMIVVIVMLLGMILTRWGSISRLAGDSIRQRFVPPAAEVDTLRQ